MIFDWAIFAEGLGTGAGLIIAIGAQNAFVLKQGIVKRHVFAVALTCAIVDAILICAGVFGLGALIQASTGVLYAAGIFGAAFLTWYGVRSFLAGLKPRGMATDTEAESPPKGNGLRAAVLTVLGLSLLNPHVYLDTVVLLGGIGGRHLPELRASFIAGALSASALWFFGLAYGAGFLAPIFKKPATWRILDFAIAAIMWLIAIQLVIYIVTLET